VLFVIQGRLERLREQRILGHHRSVETGISRSSNTPTTPI